MAKKEKAKIVKRLTMGIRLLTCHEELANGMDIQSSRANQILSQESFSKGGGRLASYRTDS